MPEQTPPTAPEPEKKVSQRDKDRRWWKRWLLLLLLLLLGSCTALDGSLRGMLSLSFDLGQDIRNLIGDRTVTGRNGTGYIDVAAPGGGIGGGATGGAAGQASSGQGTAGGATGGTGGTGGATGGAEGGGGTDGGTTGGTTGGGQGGSSAATGGGASNGQASSGTSPAGGPASSGGSATAGNGSSAPAGASGQGGSGQGSNSGGTTGGTGGGPTPPPSPPTPPPSLQPIVVTVALIGRNGNTLTPDFHFEAGSARLVLDERRFTPGFYTLRVSRYDPNTGQTTFAEQPFAWGVLALNTDKDRYRPGETGKIDIGVLDEFGEIVCDAALTLTIAKPDGTVTQLSTSEGTIDVTGTCGLKQAGLLTPDYTADFTYGQEGSYELLLEAVRPDAVDNAVSTLSTTVQVLSSPPYIVKREAATRLWPFGPSTMDIQVEFLQPYAGDITDIVPDGFQILGVDPAATTFTDPDGATRIAWSGSWSAGQTASFGYLYDAPDISPEFYLIGPLTFDPDDGASTEELRQWQIANDAAAKATSYKIPTDVVAAGGGEPGKSDNFLIADTIGEPGIGFGRSDTYDINAGYRQSAQGSYIAVGCTNVVDLGSVTFGGTLTNDATCNVTTDSDGGYRLSWRSGVNNNDSLVGYWPLDETSGTTAYDLSGYANAGTHQNSPTITNAVASGYFSTRALSMDGSDDYVSNAAVATELMAGRSVWSVSLWAQASAYGSNKAALSFNAGDGGSQTFALYPYDSDNGNGARVHFNGTNIIDQNTTSVPANGSYHHFAFVSLSATDQALYVDGKLVGRSATSKTLDLAIDQFNIGTWKSGNQHYAGGIDDVRVYSRALSDEEVRTLASLSPPGSMTQSGSQVTHIPPYNYPATGGLLGHWRLDEPVSGDAADASGRHNDGVPAGASGTNNKPQPSADVPVNAGFRDFRSLDFDGTDDVVTTGLTSGKTFTWSAWFKTDTNVDYRSIVVIPGGSYMLMDIAGGAGSFWSSDGLAGASLGVSGLSTGTWYHLVFVREGDSITNGYKAYLNGAFAGANNTGVWSSSDVISFGNRPGYSQPFDGKLNDIRIYNRALTAAEVSALYGTPQTWSVAANAAAWGGRLKSSSTDTDAKWGTDSSSEKFLHVGDGEYPLTTRATPNHPSGSTEIIQFKAEIGATKVQQPGVYRSVVLVTATAL